MEAKKPLDKIYGLVTACDWDHYGNPIKVKISTDSEQDYYVSEPEMNHKLLDYLKSWVEVTGQIRFFEIEKVMEVKETTR